MRLFDNHEKDHTGNITRKRFLTNQSVTNRSDEQSSGYDYSTARRIPIKNADGSPGKQAMINTPEVVKENPHGQMITMMNDYIHDMDVTTNTLNSEVNTM